MSPTQSITLPITQKEIQIKEWITVTEKRQLEKIVFEMAKNNSEDFDAICKAEDDLYQKIVIGISVEEIRELPHPDYEFLKSKVDEVFGKMEKKTKQ